MIVLRKGFDRSRWGKEYATENVFLNEVVEDLGHVLSLVLTVDNVAISLRFDLGQGTELEAEELEGI